MWFGKWIVACKITNDFNILSGAINQIIYRSSASLSKEEGGHTFGISDIFSKNFDTLMSGLLPIILSLLIILLICLIIFSGEKFSATKSMALTFLFIAVMPFIWYAFVKNHSYVHDFLAYRDLAVTIFSLTCFFTESLREVDR